MPFPCKQKFRSCVSFPAIERIGKFQDGIYSESFQVQSELKLPDVETTRLSKLIEAGIDLKQVNTKVINVKSVSIPSESVELSNDKKEEVNNEN